MEIIVAAANNSVIGFQNKLPWHLPADLAHFKKLTTQQVVLMGRKTYESIGKPLPNRENWVLSRTSAPIAGVRIFRNWEEVLGAEPTLAVTLFLIGGAQLYKQALDNHWVTKIHLTRVHTSIPGDAFFPDPDTSLFQLKKQAFFSKDEKNAYDYTFELWEK